MSLTSSSTFLIPAKTTSAFPLPTSSALPNNPAADLPSYMSSTTTSLIACIVPMVALLYLAVLSWTYHSAQKNPRPLNKTSGIWAQKYAPVVYVVLVLISLIEVAFASWLLLQYRFNSNYPNSKFRAGIRLLLFTSSWTTLTAGAYSLLFLHPTWSRHSVSSVGAQVIWIFVTWLFWVIGAGVVNNSVPTLLDKGSCGQTVYCGQIRGLFGTGVAVVQSLTLSGGMLAMLWLAWQSARYSLKPASSFSMN